MAESIRTRIARGDLLVGTIVSLPSPDIAEILSRAGFDWLFVDLEHSALGIREAQAILQAVQPHTACLVRVPAIDEAWVKKALDAGAEGIILPQVKTSLQCRRAVELCRYPPAGVRSVGIARAHGYGFDFQGYVASANDDTAVVVQIEHIEAVAGIDDILAVPGVDAVFVGPYDLSASMGKAGQTTAADVQQAISRVRESARRARIPLGIFGATAEAAAPYIQQGCTLVAVGTDTLLLGKAARDVRSCLP
jgi:2-dehydro-3-deoxyglucarate aldolase